VTLHQIIQFFAKYKYEAIFPVAVAEGPIITIICGFLISRGSLDFFPALLVVFLGDVISDSVFYFLGRGGRHMIGYLKFLRISEERIQKLENQFKLSPWKTMALAKISYGLGGAFMAASGASRVSWENFIEYIVSLDFVRSSILLAIGFYFGRIALRVGQTYFKYYVAAVIILVPMGYLLYLYRKKLKKSQ
jgi:membrane protein DedA with SNARE-associated domain